MEKDVLTHDDLCRLITALLSHPYMFSFIEEYMADELERRGLFSMEDFAVTEVAAKKYAASAA